MILQAAISIDIDTLDSIYHGQGCTRPGGYSYAEFELGLENLSRFLEPYGIHATLFMVGKDFERPQHQALIRDVAQTHELANHTYSHAQGFRLLPSKAKECEIASMENLCLQVTGYKPIGFRSPGWNISDDALPILLRRGYYYDSSVFPTSLTPLMKLLHWRSMSQRSSQDRTTLGQWRYMLAPTRPYRVGESLGARGRQPFVEFPISVMPGLRLPFFATFLLSTGQFLFQQTYHLLRALGYPIQFMFHLSDFVDYTQPHFHNQVPQPGRGQYVPKALQLPIAHKYATFKRALDILARDYSFIRLDRWAQRDLMNSEISYGSKSD